jgi:hypothetical protein
MPSSCHPPHTFKGVPKGLATRIRRICSSSTSFQEQGNILKKQFTNRGYNHCKVQTATDEMAQLDRQSLLQYKEQARMADVFKDPPMTSFRRPRKLKGMVVRTRLDNPLPNGRFKTCTDLRCQLWRCSSDTESFNSPVTVRSYRILGNSSCKTNNCIYIISCGVCHKQYIGETTDLRKRINNHRSSIRTKKTYR